MQERQSHRLDQSVVEPLFALYRNGEFARLAACAEPLLKQFPEAPVLHSLLGAAHLELGDNRAAVADFRNALQYSPDLEKLHNSLGIAYLRLRRDEDAAGCFRTAIDRNPEFAPAWFNLGIVEENRQHWPRAAQCYRKAIELNPRYAEAHDSLGSMLWRMGEERQAAEHYEQALALRPDYPAAYSNYLNFLEKANRYRDLEALLARAEQTLGDHALVRLYKGILADIEGDPDRARSLLEAASLDGEDDVAMHLERDRLARLARVCDTLEETGNALQYAGESNRLSATLYERKGIDKQAYLDGIAYRKRYFTPANLCQWPPQRPGGEEQPPVFIVGFPGSGTTLLDAILRGHHLIRVTEEIDAVAAVISQLESMDSDPLARLAALSPRELQTLRETYFSRLHQHVQAPGPDSVLVDRSALNIVHVGEIVRVFPEARIILLLRHPADCVLSCYLRAFYETAANANFCSLEDAAALYGEIFTLWKRFVENLDLDWLQVRYEDIVEDMESACRPVLDFIGVPWDEGILDYQRSAREREFIRTASYNQVIRPIYSQAKGRWRRYRDAMQPVLPVLQPWMEYFGYSD